MDLQELDPIIQSGAAAGLLCGVVVSLVSTSHMVSGPLIGFTVKLYPNLKYWRHAPDSAYAHHVFCRSADELLEEMGKYVELLKIANVHEPIPPTI